jgi:hypothetical protein
MSPRGSKTPNVSAWLSTRVRSNVRVVPVTIA